MLSCEENTTDGYSLGLNWRWAAKSNECSLKKGELVCSPILVSSLLSLVEDIGLGQFLYREKFPERNLVWDTGVAENNCWARIFITLVWAKYCLLLSYSFASPVSLFLTEGDGCLRHGSNSRSYSYHGYQTRKGTPSPTEWPPHTQDPWKFALSTIGPCYHAQSTPAQSPLHTQRSHRMVWPSSHTYPTLTSTGAAAQHAYAYQRWYPSYQCHVIAFRYEQKTPMDTCRVFDCGLWS